MNTRAEAIRAPASERILIYLNAAALVAAYVLPRAFAVGSMVVAARALGSAAFGEYTTAAAIAVMASILATLGSQPLIIREIARDPSRAARLVAAAHTIKCATVVVMVVSVIAGAMLLGLHGRMLSAVMVLVAAYAVGAFVENQAAYFIGIERMHHWTEASALFGLVSGIAGITLVLATHDILSFAAAPLLGQLAAFAWLQYRAPAGMRGLVRPTKAEVVALTRSLAPFAVAFIATTVYYRADLLMLARLRSAHEVGLYGAANKILDITQALALAGAGALLPRLSRLRADGRGTMRSAQLLVLAGTIPVAFALVIMNASFVRVVFGSGYADAAPVLMILAPVMVPLALNMFGLVFLAANDRMKSAALAFGIATVINVGLNAVWIPALGAIGAARSKLVAEMVLALMIMVALRPKERQ